MVSRITPKPGFFTILGNLPVKSKQRHHSVLLNRTEGEQEMTDVQMCGQVHRILIEFPENLDASRPIMQALDRARRLR
jgi:hypothetical protein